MIPPETNRGRVQELDLLAIDVRDGQTLYERLHEKVANTLNQIDTKVTVQPGLSRMIVAIGSGKEVLTLTFVPTVPKTIE